MIRRRPRSSERRTDPIDDAHEAQTIQSEAADTLPINDPPESHPTVGSAGDFSERTKPVQRLPSEREGELLVLLLVEDNAQLTGYVSESLMNAGFHVITAFDSRDAFEKAVSLCPDLVVSDMVPGMEGDALVRALRQQPRLRSVPIVVLTSNGNDDFRASLMRSGADEYLIKPFSLDELNTRIRKLIARKRSGEDSGRPGRRAGDAGAGSQPASEPVESLLDSSLLALLQTIALKAQSLTAAEFAAVGIGTDPNHSFETWAFAGLSHEVAAKIGVHPRPVGLLGLAAKEHRSIRLRDLRFHPEHNGFPLFHPLMTSFISVPIPHLGQPVGSVYVANKRGASEFTPHDQELVETLAQSVGVAIETAGRYAEEKRERKWLDAVVDQMPEGIVLMDADGRVTKENRFVRVLAAGEKLRRVGDVNETAPHDRFGNPMTLELRRPSGEALPADELPIVKALVERETVHGQELLARRGDGRLVPLLVGAAPIRGANGELAGATMILEDISVLKEVEHLREEWSSIVAHDLQQPIQAILLRIDILLRDSLSDEQADHLRHVRVAIKRMSRMVRDLLDASQLETNRMRITLKRLDLVDLITDIVTRDPGAKTRTKIQTTGIHQCFVRGDAQRLEQIITNLVSNAMKYGLPDTDVELSVTVVDDTARVSVTNRGPGIPAEDLPLIFERHARSRAARLSVTKGLGLGLYIARGLVEAHGGRIWAESIPNETTTFHFTIPLDGPR